MHSSLRWESLTFSLLNTSNYLSRSFLFFAKASLQAPLHSMLTTATATIDELISDLDGVACFGLRVAFGKRKVR
jgi:hypothetical protein